VAETFTDSFSKLYVIFTIFGWTKSIKMRPVYARITQVTSLLKPPVV